MSYHHQPHHQTAKHQMVQNMSTMHVRYSTTTPSAPHRSALANRANGAAGGGAPPLPFGALKSPTTLCFERMLGAGKFQNISNMSQPRIHSAYHSAFVLCFD